MDGFKATIAQKIAALIEGADSGAIQAMIAPCRRKELGDLSVPCFRLKRHFADQSPPQIAQTLATKLAHMGGVTATGPFLNFRLDEAAVARGLLGPIVSDENWGGSQDGAGKTIVIDYSSPNIAKPFGIGHLRSTVIGRAIKRLYESQGYKVVGVNHIGDWGTQFGFMIAAWKRWGDEVKDRSDRIDAFYELYVRINALAKEDESVRVEARGWFKKLEDGDEEALELWRFFRSNSLAEFQRIYELLGVSFEEIAGEAFYNDKMAPVLERIVAKGITKISEGALIIDLDEQQEGLGKCLLRKADGATLYATRDLAAAYYRHESYQPEKIIYVVGVPQSLHFQQLFKVVELMGEDWAGGLTHVAFGHYLGMKTREGNLVFLDEVIERAQGLAGEIAAGIERQEKLGLSEEEIREVAIKVGIGAVVFFDLGSKRTKDITFDWDRMLQLKGDAGPYLQFGYARACGILRKNDRPLSSEVDFAALYAVPENEKDRTRELVKELGRYPEILRRALAEHEPSLVSHYLLDLSKAWHRFAHDCNVIRSEDALRNARALLVEATRRVFGKALDILGIPVMEKM